MLDRLPTTERRRTVAGDRGYDQQRFVEEARSRKFTPHVAQNNSNRRSAINGRTTRHTGYRESQRRRKLVEQTFGWKKSVGLLRKLRHRGSDRVGWIFTFTAAVYNWRGFARSRTRECAHEVECLREGRRHPREPTK